MHFNYVCCFLCFIFNFRIVMSFSLPKENISKESTIEKKENSDFTNETNISLMDLEKIESESSNITKIRSKRQGSGAGKFTEAAKMPQVKMMRLFTQLFKNLWDAAYLGGAHPFHPSVPKTVAALYRQKIVEFFVPDVGEDPEKATI